MTAISAEDASHRHRIIQAARDWIGTPYRHQASLKHAGCDCLGLLRGVWRDLYGRASETPPPYSPDWAPLDQIDGTDILYEGMARNMREIPPGTAGPGDVLLFRMAMGAPSRHAAIQTAATRITHAYWGRGVVESQLVPWWRRRIAAAFSFQLAINGDRSWHN